MTKFFKFFVRNERGVSAMEYAIMAGLVAVALGAIGSTFKTNITTLFTNMWTSINNAQTGTTS